MMEPSKPLPSGSQTVLVVDDDSATLLLCRRKLEQNGFTVLQAQGSSEALKLCADHSGAIHLLLTDLMLPPPMFQLATGDSRFPRVHGHDLVRRVLKQRPDTRVILMSAYSDEELKGHGVAKDRLPFLQKPFTGDVLLQKVREALAGPPVALEEPSKPGAEAKDIEWFD
jgi:CheY-like chemotaxis protein